MNIKINFFKLKKFILNTNSFNFFLIYEKSIFFFFYLEKLLKFINIF
jgi:hypothetical protein